MKLQELETLRQRVAELEQRCQLAEMVEGQFQQLAPLPEIVQRDKLLQRKASAKEVFPSKTTQVDQRQQIVMKSRIGEEVGV